MSLRSEVIRIFNELLGSGVGKKISELPAATTPLAGTEQLEIVQGGESRKVTAATLATGGTGVETIVAGTNIMVDATDPQNPIVSASGGGGSGTVESVTGDGVNNTDPDNPVISYPTPGDIGAATTGSVSTVATNLSNHIADSTDAHAASAITNTPSGTISSTDVQGAINEISGDVSTLSTTVSGLVIDSIADSDTTHAPSRNAVFDALALKVAKTGDTMSGNLAMGSNKVTGLAAATANGDAVRYEQLIAIPKVIQLAVSDETTAITTGTSKITFRMPYAMTLTAVRASLSTSQTSGSIFTVDINESGGTILSTKLTIDNTEKTSTTAATPPVISDTALADDAEITIDVDQVGDGTAKGLKVTLIGV